jgi:16S rRNA (guanine966-N2)-methyltransferase
MRIIAGVLKGRRLVTPRGPATRPTADQVRLALMDALTPWLPGARILDLFAGAGGVGLEGISRGAAHATFVERDARALSALKQNVATLGLPAQVRILSETVERALARLGREGARFDIVFLDPPYETELIDGVLKALADGGLAGGDGIVVVQHLTKRPPGPAPSGLSSVRTRRFGETTLTFFRAGEYDAPSAAAERTPS